MVVSACVGSDVKGPISDADPKKTNKKTQAIHVLIKEHKL